MTLDIDLLYLWFGGMAQRNIELSPGIFIFSDLVHVPDPYVTSAYVPVSENVIRVLNERYEKRV